MTCLFFGLKMKILLKVWFFSSSFFLLLFLTHPFPPPVPINLVWLKETEKEDQFELLLPLFSLVISCEGPRVKVLSRDIWIKFRKRAYVYQLTFTLSLQLQWEPFVKRAILNYLSENEPKGNGRERRGGKEWEREEKGERNQKSLLLFYFLSSNLFTLPPPPIKGGEEKKKKKKEGEHPPETRKGNFQFSGGALYTGEVSGREGKRGRGGRRKEKGRFLFNINARIFTHHPQYTTTNTPPPKPPPKPPTTTQWVYGVMSGTGFLAVNGSVYTGPSLFLSPFPSPFPFPRVFF